LFIYTINLVIGWGLPSHLTGSVEASLAVMGTSADNKPSLQV